MRIATMTVALSGFRMLRGNGPRTSVAIKVLSWCASNDVDAVFFPAGFLRARDKTNPKKVANSILKTASRLSLSVAVGVDLCTQGEIDKAGNQGRMADIIRRSALPMGIIAWWPGADRPVFWRQRSTSSSNHHLVPDDSAQEVRTLLVKGREVAVLACGEANNIRTRVSVLAKQPMVSAVVVAAHTAKGSRMHNPLHYFASNGYASFLSAHTMWGDGLKQARLPGNPPINPNRRAPLARWDTSHTVEIACWDRVQGQWHHVEKLLDEEH